MADYQYIGEGRADGCIIFTNATKKGAFFGKTPIVQPSGAAQAAAGTTAATSTTPYGFATSTQANALINLVDAQRNALVSLGLMKGSA